MSTTTTPYQPPRASWDIKTGVRKAIHPSDIHGFWVKARRAAFAVLIVFYVVAPFITIHGHPAVHLDIINRRFFLFGQTYNAQDFWMVVLVAMTVGFSLLFVTALHGRVWCGWACPQTVWLEAVFRPIERWIDGPRERRMKLAQEPWTPGNAARFALKHGLYLLAAILVAHATLALFVSVEDLTGMVRDGPGAHPLVFTWAVAMTGLMYGNFAFFREQFCVVLCPYGRMQSVMHDSDSRVVGYDFRRGEPRGKLAKGPEAPARGDCVDCGKCVTACPTGIDIRNGLQMECLSCTQCIDACDEVMVKVGKPKGLVRYDALNVFAGKPTRTVRPRLMAYASLAVLSAGNLGFQLVTREPFEANLMRVKGPPFLVTGDSVSNVFEIHLVNKSPDQQAYVVKSQAPEGVEVFVGQASTQVASLKDTRVFARVSAPRGLPVAPESIKLDICQNEGSCKTLTVPFLRPPG